MASKKKGNRILINIECADCKSRNYVTFKNRRNNPERLELSKYCKKCKKHTTHRESK